MKRLQLFTLTVLAVAAVAAACGGNPEPAPAPQPNADSIAMERARQDSIAREMARQDSIRRSHAKRWPSRRANATTPSPRLRRGSGHKLRINSRPLEHRLEPGLVHRFGVRLVRRDQLLGDESQQ